MRGSGRGLADFMRQRRLWQKTLLEGLGTARSGGGSTAGSAALPELTDFGSDPGNLRGFVHVPAGLPAGAPLVVVLHGCTQTAADYCAGAGWLALADASGFAVLAPEQRTQNNMNRCFNWFQPSDTGRDQGEAMSIRQMIEHTVRKHRLDRQRIFVTGLSAGGAMASVLLGDYPELFAGGAIVAGLPFGAAGTVQEAFAAMGSPEERSGSDLARRVRAASDHNGRWPRVSVWQGSADRTVAPANAEEIVKQWTALHGLAAKPTGSGKAGSATRRVWEDASGRALVEAYLVPGMAHGTPLDPALGAVGGSPAPYLLDVGIPSSRLIAGFWGIAAGAPTAARADAPAADEPAAPRGPDRAAAPDAPLPGGKVGEVIAKALKAAGLM